jgi:hypothetical protein
MAKRKSTSKTQDEDVQRRGPNKTDGNTEGDVTLDKTIEDSFPASDPPSSIPNPDEDAA